MGEEWFWQGAGGALIGAAGAGLVALVAIYLTRRHERALMRAQFSLRAAQDCWAYLDQLAYPRHFAPLEPGWTPERQGFGQAVDFTTAWAGVSRKLAAFAAVIDDPAVAHAVMAFSQRTATEISERFRAAAKAQDREQLQRAVDDYLMDLDALEDRLWGYMAGR